MQGRGPCAGMPGLGHGTPVQPAPCVMKQQFLLGPFGCLHIHTWEDEKGMRRDSHLKVQEAQLTTCLALALSI